VNKNITNTGFKYIDRGYEKSLVLIPGWASDYRIFSTLDLRFNYLLAADCSLDDFDEKLSKAVSEYGLKKISLLGWSLGGFLAVDFSLKYKKLIDELILVSIRKSYNPDKISEIKFLLKKSKKAYLYSFYRDCFYKKEDLIWFKDNLLKSYYQELDLNRLLRGLDYLEKVDLKPEDLSSFDKLHIIHGKLDKIAPIDDAIDIKDKLAKIKFTCLGNTGHVPFLNKDFKDWL